MAQIGLSSMPDGFAAEHLYRPKLVTVLAEGYGFGFGSLRKDVVAALTVAIVAIPLSMAIAVHIKLNQVADGSVARPQSAGKCSRAQNRARSMCISAVVFER
jgi:hypothetical protein